MPSRELMVCLVISLAESATAGPPPPELIEAFRKRQNQVENLNASLELKLSMSEESAARWQQEALISEDGAEAGNWQPTLEMQLTCDARRYFLQVEGLSPNFSAHRFEQTTETYAANGRDYRWLRQLAPDYHFSAQGVILSEGSALGRLELQPLMWGLQPLRDTGDTADWADLSHYSPSHPDAGSCIVLTDRNGQREWWFDPACDYSMVRYRRRRMEHDSLWAEITIRNTPHAVLGWVPETWTVTRFGRTGEARWEYEVRLKSLALNETLSDERFELSFPEGTIVTDGRGKRNSNWIVSSNPVATATGIYRTGDRTVPPPPVAANSSGSFIMLLVAAGATLMVILLSAVSVRRRRREVQAACCSRLGQATGARYSISA